MLHGTVTGKIVSVLSPRNTPEAADFLEFYLVETFFQDKLQFERVWFVSTPKWMYKRAVKMVQKDKHIGVNFKNIRPDSYMDKDGGTRKCIAIEADDIFWL